MSAFAAGGTYTLGATLTTPNTHNLAVGTGKTLTLNLGDYKLTVTHPTSTHAAIEVPSTATLAITDTSTDTGKLIATGGTFAAGIGSDNSVAGGTVTISGGTVTAKGGTGGAGIGGGDSVAGGTATISGGIVTATGGTFGAGIGGGTGGAGGTVHIESGATVTAANGSGASAIGNGSGSSTFGSLTNTGSLTVPSGADLAIPSGKTVANAGTITNHGSLTGAGTITNTGAIVNTGTLSSTLHVDDNNYTLSFTVSGVPGSPSAPSSLYVCASTVSDSSQALPTVAVPSGDTFVGWDYTSSTTTAVTNTTDLSTLLGAGLKTVTLKAKVTVPAPAARHTAPTAPRSLAATTSTKVVTLTWQAPATTGGLALTGYEVLRGTASGKEASTPIATLGPSVTSYTDSSVVPGVTYYYEVEATNTVGTSTVSNEVTASVAVPAPVVKHAYTTGAGMASTATGKGYWLVGADGGVFSFGTAKFHGSMGGTHLNAPVVGMAIDPVTGGYWLVGADGGVFSFTAPFYGSMGGTHLNAPVVGVVVTHTGKGYYEVASDGGVFTFGDAKFHGSMGGTHLNAPVVGMAIDPVTGDYWLVGADGGVFSFTAPFYGSDGGHPPAAGASGMVVAPTGSGYAIIAKTGRSVTYGS